MEHPSEQLLKELAYQQQTGVAGSIRVPSLRENVQAELVRALANVARLEELGQLLDESPNVGRILELMGGGKNCVERY